MGLVLLAVAGGCVRARDVALPSGGGMPELLIARELPGVGLELEAVSGASYAMAFTAREEGMILSAIYYPAGTFAEYQIAPGPVALVPDPQGRSLPEPFSSAWQWSGGPWTELETLPESLRRLRLPPLDLLQCAESGGCLEPGGAVERCLSSCPGYEAPIAPEAPALPRDLVARTVTCPPGWSASALRGDGVITCEPPGSAPIAACGRGRAQFIDTSTCAEIGVPCPVGQWREDLGPEDRIRYVAQDASGGDGTRAAPFGRVADALLSARPGDIVLLGRGIFSEAIILPDGVTLAGTCAAETTLSAPDARAERGEATIAVSGLGARVRDLRVEGGGWGVLANGASLPVSVELSGVILTVTSTGVLALGDARLTGGDLVVRDGGSTGMALVSGAAAQLARVVLEGNTHDGLVAGGSGTRAQVRDLIVRDTISGPSGLDGEGIFAGASASVELTRALLERNTTLGIAAVDPGTTATVADAIVRDTHPAPATLDNGGGVQAYLGASIVLRGALIEGNRIFGVQALNDALVRVEDAVIRDQEGSAQDQHGGQGALAAFAGQLVLERVELDRNRSSGITGAGAGARLVLAEVIVRDTKSALPMRVAGYGVNAEGGAALEVKGGLFERVHSGGIVVRFGSGRALLEDVVVRGVTLDEDAPTGGTGISLHTAPADVRRALIEQANGALSVIDADVAVEDLTTRSTLADPRTLVQTPAIVVAYGAAQLRLDRADLESSADGALVQAAGAPRAIVANLRISGCDRACVSIKEESFFHLDAAAIEGASGEGIHVGGAAAVELSHLEIRGTRATSSTSAALQIEDSAAVMMRAFRLDGTGSGGGILLRPSFQATEHGALDAADGTISGNAIGAEVYVEPFDASQLLRNVRYSGNARAILLHSTR